MWLLVVESCYDSLSPTFRSKLMSSSQLVELSIGVVFSCVEQFRITWFDEINTLNIMDSCTFNAYMISLPTAFIWSTSCMFALQSTEFSMSEVEWSIRFIISSKRVLSSTERPTPTDRRNIVSMTRNIPVKLLSPLTADKL